MDDTERIRKRLPDYFKAIEMPWPFAVSFLGGFVDDDEEPLGVPRGTHSRNLFHVAQALRMENKALTAELREAEAEAARLMKFNENCCGHCRCNPPCETAHSQDLKSRSAKMAEVIEAAETEPGSGEYAPDFLRLCAMSLDLAGDKLGARRLDAYANNLEAKRDAWLGMARPKTH